MEKQQFNSIGIFPNDNHTYKSLAILNQHNIEHRIKEVKLNEDLASYNPGMEAEQLQVYVKPEEQDKAYQLLLEVGLFTEEEVEDDPNMFADYSDEELIQVIKNSDEWGAAFVVQAEEILKERGITISDEQKEQLENIRHEELDDFDGPIHALSSLKMWTIIGTFLSIIAICYFYLDMVAWPTVGTCGFSAWWGWVYYSRKRTNSKGEEYYVYDAITRSNGQLLMYICLIVAPFSLFFSLLSDKW